MQQEQFILPKGVTVPNPQGNRYVIEGLLIREEFNAVYLVRERDAAHNLFALKEMINPNKGDRERIAFEGEVLKRLSHKALPRVHQVFENDKLKRVYLLMDYIEGKSLEALREEQPQKRFPLLLALNLLSPVVNVLTYLHTQDPPVVHRDIKPANIIVPIGGGEVVLTNFGSAKEYVPGAATNMLDHRSHGYAALEQYRTGTNPRTDIYSLGATLYALLTGSVPINAPSRVVEIMSVGVDPLMAANLLNPEIPQAISDALHQAMSIKAIDRFETVGEFWRILTASTIRQMSPVTMVDLSQTILPKQTIKGSETESLHKVRFAPFPKNREVLYIFIALLFILTVIGFFSFLWNSTVLLLCCFGILFLLVGMLLYNAFSRTSK